MDGLRCFFNNFSVSYNYVQQKSMVLFRSVLLVASRHTQCCTRPTLPQLLCRI